MHSWLNTGMQNHRYRAPTVKLYTDFPLHRTSAFLTPHVVQGSTVHNTIWHVYLILKILFKNFINK